MQRQNSAALAPMRNYNTDAKPKQRRPSRARAGERRVAELEAGHRRAAATGAADAGPARGAAAMAGPRSAGTKQGGGVVLSLAYRKIRFAEMLFTTMCGRPALLAKTDPMQWSCSQPGLQKNAFRRDAFHDHAWPAALTSMQNGTRP